MWYVLKYFGGESRQVNMIHIIITVYRSKLCVSQHVFNPYESVYISVETIDTVSHFSANVRSMGRQMPLCLLNTFSNKTFKAIHERFSNTTEIKTKFYIKAIYYSTL